MLPPRTTYELSESGRALRPVIEAIAAWSELYVPDSPPNMAEDCHAEDA